MRKIIIFDLDGTLIDSDPITIAAINEIRKEEKLLSLPDNKILPFLAMGGLPLVQHTISNSTSKIKNEYYLKRLRTKISEQKTEENILFPNVRAALDDLIARDLTLCICTNKGKPLVTKILLDLKLSMYFKNIVADGDLESRKPNKNNFLACLQGIKSIKSECVIIGDSAVDLKLAKNCGVDFLAYKNKANIDFIKHYGGPYFEDYNDLLNSNLISE